MISQTVEYALRAMVVIAQHASQPLTALRIAELTQVPAPYLSKLMQNLVRAGLVKSQRGVHGGFVLAASVDQLSVLSVVNAVEPIPRIRSCPLGIPSHNGTLCPLHRRLDQALAAVEQSFRETTLAELISDWQRPGDSQRAGEPLRLSPLCQKQGLLAITPLAASVEPADGGTKSPVKRAARKGPGKTGAAAPRKAAASKGKQRKR